MPFGVQIRWSKPKNQADDCYSSSANLEDFSKKSKELVKYTFLSSVSMPLHNSLDIPVQKRFSSSSSSSNYMVEDNETSPSSAEMFPDKNDIEPHFICQSELNKLVRNSAANLLKDQK